MIKKKECSNNYFLLLFLLVIFIGGNIKAQQMPPFKKGTDTAAIYQLMRIGQFQVDPDSGIQTLKLAVQKSIEGDYFMAASQSLIALGIRYFKLGKYPEAINYCRQSLSYAEKSGKKTLVANCYNFFGAIDFDQGNYTKASEEYFKALDVLKNIDSTNYNTAIPIYTNLANISQRLGQNDKNLYYLNQAEILVRRWNSDPEMVLVSLVPILVNKGIYFGMTNMPDSAAGYFLEVLDIAKRLGPSKAGVRLNFIADSYSNLGILFNQKKEWGKSASYCRQAIEIAQNKYVIAMQSASNVLANDLRHLQKYDEAEAILLSMVADKVTRNRKELLADGYSSLSDLYRDTRQYKKAIDYLDSATAIKDTLVTSEKTKAINQIEAKYNTAEKDKQITKNELLIAQQKNKINRKNILIGSISVSVLLLTILLIAIYRNSRLEQAGLIKSLQQENTISILKGVVQGEENERIRLARELHDGIGGMLSATKMRFMALRHENEDLVNSPKYLEAMGLLDIMGDEIRKTSHNLMPEVLLKQNLPEALRTYCNNIQAGTELQIDFQSFGNFDALSNDFKLNIYRIIQELLKNTLQHARATYAVVQLMMLEAYLTVSVEDNGIGFNTNETKDGIGLHNLKTRVLSLDGHYTLKSEQGKGTTVYVEIGMPPLTPPNEKSG